MNRLEIHFFFPSAALFLFYTDIGKEKVNLSRHFEKSVHGRWDLLLYLSIPPCDSSGKNKVSQNKMQFKSPWRHPDLRPKDRQRWRWNSRKSSLLRTVLLHDLGHIINNMRMVF